MTYIDVRKVSEDYLRNEPCDVCGRQKAVTKRAEVQFDCGYFGEMNICTWDLRTLDYREKRLTLPPGKDHFHIAEDEERTWFKLDDVLEWIRFTMNYQLEETSKGSWRFEIERPSVNIIMHIGSASISKNGNKDEAQKKKEQREERNYISLAAKN